MYTLRIVNNYTGEILERKFDTDDEVVAAANMVQFALEGDTRSIRSHIYLGSPDGEWIEY